MIEIQKNYGKINLSLTLSIKYIGLKEFTINNVFEKYKGTSKINASVIIT